MVAILDKIVTNLAPAALVAFLAVWIFALVSIIRRNKRRFFTAMGIGAGIIVIIMTLSTILLTRARHDLLRFLRENNGPFTMNIGDRAAGATEADSVLAVLRTVRPVAAHHSYSSIVARIGITDADGHAIHLQLGRDSSRPREYWIFQDEYHTTRLNEIGRVVTPIFDGYRGAE